MIATSSGLIDKPIRWIVDDCVKFVEREISFLLQPNTFHKYFARSIEYYADKSIQHQEFGYQNHITDVLANAFNSNDKKETPIQQLAVEYDFGSCKEIEACQLVTVIAEFAAIYGNINKNIDKSYGSPGGYDGEIIGTMEDLFLLALFEIYTNCVL